VRVSRFVLLLILFALTAVVAFVAGRTTSTMRTTAPNGAEHTAVTPPSVATQRAQMNQAAPAAMSPTQPEAPPEKPKGERKILYWRAPMAPNYISDKPGKSPMGMDLVPVYDDEAPAGKPTAPSEKPKGERKILYWRAPMDPNYISDKPGKSPMGMDLVPVYEDEVSSGEVRISPSVVQEIGVTTAEAVSEPFTKTIRTYGTSSWDETTLSALNTKIDGWIEKLNVNETGQLVRKGQPLIEIYSPQLVSAQQEYLSALDNAKTVAKSSSRVLAEAAGKLPEAARMRLKLWDISDAQIAALQETRAIRKTLTLYAPISGIVTHRDVMAGDFVKAGMNLVKIAALDPIWVMGSIYEDEIPMVKKGMKASVVFDSLPGESFDGTVDYVYPYVEGKSRTARLRIILPNPRDRILPQMYGTVSVQVKMADKAVQVPANAVIRASSTDNVVFIALGEGRFAGRKVVLGPEGDDGKVMVKAGLEAGERVVTSAQFLLDSESQLKAAIQSMLSHGGPSQ
jgi:RND family efflux transporter MFP subunit